MRYFKLRNKIAFTYIGVTALLVAALFVLIYLVILKTVYDHLDADLNAEMQEVYSSIVVLDNAVIFANPNEWHEREHGMIEVNPTFIQVVDTSGGVLRKTPNLLDGALPFNRGLSQRTYFDTTLAGAPIRQTQMPIQNPTGRVLAYLVIAVPLQESSIVLGNLRQTLLIGYPLVLLALFFISRFIAGKAISPVNSVISTAEKISRENLNQRIMLPRTKDELHTLAQTVNDLLDRLEDVVVREKQFTADASHELRTPLSVIKGTLEVLVRKPRSREQYEEQIRYVIGEVDRMSLLVEQLLELARYESGARQPSAVPVDLLEVVDESFARLHALADEKCLALQTAAPERLRVNADRAMTTSIIENILSNAIKYSPDHRSIEVEITREENRVACAITDHGDGIPEDQIEKIFDRFYRVDESRTSNVPGKGVGLAIVKRLAELQNLEITVRSTPAVGTTFTVYFHAAAPSAI